MRLFLSLVLRILPYAIIFLGSLYHPRDPDLGWHLRYGEYFFTQGTILKENTFSQLMGDFQWVNSSWMTDIVSFDIYASTGFLGLAIASSLIVTLTAFFFARFAKLTWWDEVLLFPLLLFFLEPVISVSFRGQLISLMLMGILFYCIDLYKQGRHISLLLIPLLFMAWSNLHGQFFMGLVLFGLWVVIYVIMNLKEFGLRETKKRALPLLMTLAASAIFCLINPFGIGVFQEAIIHIRNPDLQLVSEYLPIDERSGIWRNHTIVTGILILSGTFLVFTDLWKQTIPEVVILIILFGLSYWVRRYAWPFYWFSLFALRPIVTQMAPPSEKSRFIVGGIMSIIIFVFVLLLKLPLSQYQSMTWESYCRLTNCTQKGADALLSFYKGEKLFTTYDFGGWLIWNYRGIVPTIDGRMHLWRDEHGFRAISYYWPIEQNLTDIDTSDYQFAFVSVKKPVSLRLEELTEEGRWERLYQDDVAAIYKRMK